MINNPKIWRMLFFNFIYSFIFWCKSKMWNIRQNKKHHSFFVIIIVKKVSELSGQLQVSVQHNFWHQHQKATSSYLKANFDVFKRSYQLYEVSRGELIDSAENELSFKLKIQKLKFARATACKNNTPSCFGRAWKLGHFGYS